MEKNYYWVKYKKNPWTTMNKGEDGVWWSGSFTWDDDDALKAEGYAIGPRIPSPEELAEKDKVLEELRCRTIDEVVARDKELARLKEMLKQAILLWDAIDWDDDMACSDRKPGSDEMNNHLRKIEKELKERKDNDK